MNLDIGVYGGVDLNEAAIAWLQANIHDRRFRFVHLNVRNAWYRADGPPSDKTDALTTLGMTGFDAACMFSVITHQEPNEASLTFAQLRRAVSDGGHLYFTAFTDCDAQGYIERDPDRPGLLSTYHPDLLGDLLEVTGWDIQRIHPKLDNLQHTVFVCRAA